MNSLTVGQVIEELQKYDPLLPLVSFHEADAQQIQFPKSISRYKLGTADLVVLQASPNPKA